MNFLKRALCVLMCFCLCVPSLDAIADTITTVDVNLQMDKVRALPEGYGKSLLSDKLPLYMDYKSATAGNFTRTFVADSTDNFNITNGNTDDSWHMTKQVFADYNGGSPKIYKDGEAACRFTFKLDCVTSVTAICLINHPTSVLMAEKYEIYASSEYRKLFWTENRVAYVNNPDSCDRQLLTLNKNDVVYVGINIIFPCQTDVDTGIITLNASTNNYYPRISEFAVYGIEGDEVEFPSLQNTVGKTVLQPSLSDGASLDLSQSFLSGVSPKIYTKSTGGSVVDRTATTTTNAYLTDGSINSGDWQGYSQRFAVSENGIQKIVGGENHYLDIVFDAGSEKELSVFYLRNHDRMSLRTAHYKLFASNNPYSTTSGGLTADTNLIGECYNSIGAQDNYFIVPEGNTLKARYYCIRIYDSCFDYSDPLFTSDTAVGTDGFLKNGYTRLCEISAFSLDTMSPTLSLNGFEKQGSDYGYIKPGTKVKSILNAFTGRGELRVEDAEGNLKAPGMVLACGDKVIADTDYGKEVKAGFKFCGDLNNSGSLSLTDVLLMGESIVKQTTNTQLSDIDGNGEVSVTDMVKLSAAIMGNFDHTLDKTPAPKYGQKYGTDADGRNEIIVDMDTVLEENFRGFGANAFTSTLTSEGMDITGYNKVYHELTKKRIASMKPSVSRVWFQVDWIVTNTIGDKYKNYATNWHLNPDYINYKNGIYDFENETMQAFYEYIEMLADYGSTIEINFGWKTGTRIQYWFNAPCKDYKSGVPKDLEAFGKAAAALIKYLNEEKGYDFIEAITFYNEPNTDGDFERDDESDMDERIYWSQLVREVKAALTANHMESKVEVWGPEVAAMEKDSTKDWFSYQLLNSKPYIDQWTGHKYYHSELFKNNYSETFDTFLYYSEQTGGNIMVTEMYSAISNDTLNQWCSWNDSFASYYIAASNTGINGILTWTIMGGYLPDPSNLNLSSNETSAWYVPNSEETAGIVNRIFYEESIFTNYIPDGSKVLHTGWIGNDIRAAAYLLPDGNVTVVVENNGINEDGVFYKGEGTEKKVTIALSDGVDRAFNRISYIADSQEINANATVNRPDKALTTSGGKLTDTLGEGYSVHIYTTASPIKQVEMDYVIRHTTPKRSIPINGTMLDCDEDDELIYTISEYTGSEPGTLENGYYKPASTAKAGDMVAVRASLKSDPNVFGVTIIYID